MYTQEARTRRRCTATRRDGQPCGAWALWDDPAGRQLCNVHAGRHHRGEMPLRWLVQGETRSATQYVPCTCVAYAWPHRPGGGLCRWPEPPRYRCTIPAGTHRWLRLRR